MNGRCLHRQVRTLLSTALSLLFIWGGSAKAQGNPVPAETLDPNTYHTPDHGPVFDRLYPKIRDMAAFNHHYHSDDEEATLAWFHPHTTVGKTEHASFGVVPGLLKLLEMEGDQITEETRPVIEERYRAFVENNTQTEYYHKLGDATHVEETLFMVFPSETAKIRSLPSHRLKIAIYIDHFLFPLDNGKLKAQHPSYANRLGMVEGALAAEEATHGPRPKKFDAYLTYVDQAIAHHRTTPGVIGGKWGFSYWRSFDVQPVEKDIAGEIYERNGDVSLKDYKKLQDYMAFHVLKACADQEFPLQIHTGLGADPGLILADTNPALLDRLLARPEVRHGRVVLIHGSYPFCKELGVIARRENVWLDFSWMPLLLPPETLAGYLKEWIELDGPWDVLFGVDAAGLALLRGNWVARQALAIALSRMVEEGQITESEALQYAAGILRNNALHVYEKTLEKEATVSAK